MLIRFVVRTMPVLVLSSLASSCLAVDHTFVVGPDPLLPTCTYSVIASNNPPPSRIELSRDGGATWATVPGPAAGAGACGDGPCCSGTHLWRATWADGIVINLSVGMPTIVIGGSMAGLTRDAQGRRIATVHIHRNTCSGGLFYVHFESTPLLGASSGVWSGVSSSVVGNTGTNNSYAYQYNVQVPLSGPHILRAMLSDCTGVRPIGSVGLVNGLPLQPPSGPRPKKGPCVSPVFSCGGAVGPRGRIALPVTVPSDASVSWYKDETPLIDGPTSSGSLFLNTATATMSIVDPAPIDSGTYYAVLTSMTGELSFGAMHQIRTDPVGPVIQHDAQRREACLGGSTEFLVAASGTGLAYYWMKNGAILANGPTGGGDVIAGAFTPTLSISGLVAASAGDYSCLVWGATASEITYAATLTVSSSNIAPDVTQNPTPQTVRHGDDLTLTAASSEPLAHYRWRRNGAPLIGNERISGAEHSQLIIFAAEPIDQGAYDCVITRACTSAVTSSATLTVTCLGDFNGQNGVTVNDIFDFLAAWFTGCSSVGPNCPWNGDFNRDGMVSVNDIFDFLSAWFGDC